MWSIWLYSVLLLIVTQLWFDGGQAHSSNSQLMLATVDSDLLRASKESLQAGHPQEAISLANKALAAGIYGLEPMLIKAIAALQLGNYEQAIRDSSQYLTSGGKSTEAYQIRGNAFGKQGKILEAIDDFSTAIRHEPDNALYWTSRGSLRVTIDQAEQGLEDLEMAAKLGRRTPGVYFDRGTALRQLGRNEEAYESYTQALSLKPGYRIALLERGLILECLGKDIEAVKDYSELIRNNPQDNEARLYRAWVYAELGELSSSEEDLHWIINKGGNKVAAFIQLSNVQLRKGNVSDAIKANEHALKLAEESNVRYQILSGYQRGLLLLAEGKLDEARRRYAATNNEAEKALDAIAVEEAIRRLKGAEQLFTGKKKIREEEFLSSLEKLQEQIQSQSKEDASYCRRGYF